MLGIILFVGGRMQRDHFYLHIADAVLPSDIMNEMANDPTLVGFVFDGMQHESECLRDACEQLIKMFAAEYPCKLYPHLNSVLDLVYSGNQAKQQIGRELATWLAGVDCQGKLGGLGLPMTALNSAAVSYR
jgi:hypothetical protein